MTTQNKATHTAGPWKIMPCPQHAGKHPFHDSRWIATEGAVPEFGHDPRSWTLESGSLICEMRDGDIEANARLIAAAPETAAERDRLLEEKDVLLEALRSMLHSVDTAQEISIEQAIQARAAIQRATQP